MEELLKLSFHNDNDTNDFFTIYYPFLSSDDNLLKAKAPADVISAGLCAVHDSLVPE